MEGIIWLFVVAIFFGIFNLSVYVDPRLDSFTCLQVLSYFQGAPKGRSWTRYYFICIALSADTFYSYDYDSGQLLVLPNLYRFDIIMRI